MINPFKEVNWNPDRQQKRQFARSLVIGFPVLALLWLVVGKISGGVWPVQLALCLGGIGAGLGLILWTVPVIAKPFYFFWYAIACSIGMVISNLLLTTFYLVVVTLFGVLRRAFGRTPIRKRLDKGAPTYWMDAEKITNPKRYFSQF